MYGINTAYPLSQPDFPKMKRSIQKTGVNTVRKNPIVFRIFHKECLFFPSFIVCAGFLYYTCENLRNRFIQPILTGGSMRLYLTGTPCTQKRHCYVVQGDHLSFIFDCGYQRAYRGDELPHLSPEQIQQASYLFITHSHENQSGALPRLFANGFHGRVVLTTETARQLPFPIDDPVILEAMSLPYETFTLPGGLHGVWGRSGHCSGSAWFRLEENGHSIFFSGDYYGSARVHACDPIVDQNADLAVLDCSYGRSPSFSQKAQMDRLIRAITVALADGRPVLLPVPKFGRGIGILSYICEKLPYTDVFADTHFITELGHLDASAMWVRENIQDVLDSVHVRSIPENLVALGVYFVSDDQLDSIYARDLVSRLLVCGGRVIFTGTVEPGSRASLLIHSGQASLLRYNVHSTQTDMLQLAARNSFSRIIAYDSDFAPTQSIYEF